MERRRGEHGRVSGGEGRGRERKTKRMSIWRWQGNRRMIAYELRKFGVGKKMRRARTLRDSTGPCDTEGAWRPAWALIR